MTHKRITILIGLFLAIISVYGQTGYSETLTLKQRLHLGEQIKQVRVPTHATREDVLVLIKVPTVEDEETAQKIIDSFYYPPMGKRSLGGAFNWGEKIGLVPEGMPYHEWWNNNGILGIKLETVKGVLLARFLAKPGIDFMEFGGQDLGHDISIQKHPGFETIEDCRTFVENALKGTNTVF